MHIDAVELLALLDRDLYSAGWNGALNTYPGQPTAQFAMSHLRKSLVKKYLPGTSDKNPKADLAAFSKFTQVNERCANWRMDTPSITELEAVAIGETKVVIDSFFFPDWSSDGLDFQPPILNMASIAAKFTLGSGANIGSKSTDLYSKLALSTMDATSAELHGLYRQCISESPSWRGLELSRARLMGSRVTSSSRLSFVPKTTEISRTICTEPVLNMLFQQGVGLCIRERLLEVFGIDLVKQPNHNAVLARLGSQDNRFGTIDLSSASDSISIGLCDYILPRQVTSLLKLFRCSHTTLPGGLEPLELHMISSMGNAFTFPLQTMLFAAIVCGCYRAYDIHIVHPRGNTLGNYAVFGDDIIVLQRVYPLVVRLLHLFGFEVNADKSFNEGPFRESCGHDYYHGTNVRGVYISRLRDANDCYSAINRLVRWSARHSVLLPNLVSFLTSKVRFLPVPYDESDDAGIKVPTTVLTGQRFNRFNGGIPYRYSSLRDRQVRIQQNEVEQVLVGYYHLESGERIPLWDPVSDSVWRPLLPSWYENPDGLMIALLAGSIRNRFVTLRSQKRKAAIRRRHSPSWDWVAPVRGLAPSFATDWKAVAEVYFTKH